MSSEGPAVHVRTVRCEARQLGADILEVTGHLVDERPGGGQWFGVKGPEVIHDMRLTVRVRCPDLVITSVQAVMTAHPYRLCPDATPSLQRLVGLSIARGFTRAVNERLGRERGCAHMTALIQAMAPVVKQGAGARGGDAESSPGESDTWFVNSCHAWRAGGPLHTRLLAGDAEGLRALSAWPPLEASDPL